MRRISILLFTIVFLIHSPALPAQSARMSPVVKVVQEWGPSVVNISTEQVVLLRQQPFWKGYGNVFDQWYADFLNQGGMMSAVKLKTIGSGVLVDVDGVIVTNAHVVNMASKIYIVFRDGSQAEGEVILTNQQDDLALIKINPRANLKAVKLADPDQVMIGETVIAIGNPFGLENSVSSGVISGKNRQFTLPQTGHTFSALIQTDASINIGSSGGALLNLDGELVGINLALLQQAENIGFAVSSKKIQDGLDLYHKQKPIRIPVQ